MKMITPMLISIILFACSENNESSKSLNEETIAAHPTFTQNIQNDLYSSGNTDMIKIANYRFSVNDVKKSLSSIELLLQRYPAFISSSEINLKHNSLESEMTIRVQNEYFNELLKEVDKLAEFIHYRNISTNDVSKEFVDLESRLKTKREVEERYSSILRNKAGTIEELLAAEKQIGALHEEIEATISRINFLKDQVSYSTIHLNFYQELDPERMIGNKENLSAKFSEAFSSGLQGMVQIAIALTYGWPLIIPALVTLLFWRWKRKASVKAG